jgi:GNAT superfamily N-acetyltransferase
MAVPRRVPADSPDALALVGAMFAEIGKLYPFTGDPGPSATPQDFSPPGGGFVALYEGDRAVAGGGIKRLEPGVGEIKRMYVVPDRRGAGLSRELLVALEDLARDLGHERLRLDTGVHQHAALHLYGSAGYLAIDDYNDNPYASYWGENRL